MPYARRYETFEVRALLQGAEGVNSPVTGVGAHARTLHARSTPGGLGVTPSDMMHRTHKLSTESNNQFKNRGGAVQTSAFANLIQQADAACQALNSDKGRQALQVLDSGTHAGKKLRITLTVKGIREIGFLGGLGHGRMSSVHKTHTSVSGGQANGVQLIIDCVPGTTDLHIQTCYPLSDLNLVSKFEIRDLGSSNAQVAVG